jgi:retron-type reverse transcriptase
MRDIFGEIIALDNLFAAWREFRRGKRAKPDVREFERHLEDHVFDLHDDLESGAYRHGPYHRFHIFDPKHRVIHKASVRDRLVHHAVHRVLYPIFEKSFIFDSYSCRIGKGTHAAVRRLENFTRRVSRNYTGPCWALKFDVRKFFDSVDHGILMQEMASSHAFRHASRNDKLMNLLEEVVSSFSKSKSVGGGSFLETNRKTGLPIGNLTSQLFANVYLDAFDHFIKNQLRIRHYIRYTDDAVILSDDPAYLTLLVPIIEQWLWAERRLELHPRKIEIRKLSQGIDFLGYVTLPHHRVLRTKTKRRMLARVNSANLPSYLGLLRHCSGRRLGQIILFPRIQGGAFFVEPLLS